MSTRNGTQKAISLTFVTLTVILNIALFYSTKRTSPVICTTDSIFESIAVYFAHNGAFPLDKFLSNECPAVSMNTREVLLDSVKKLKDNCYTMLKRSRTHVKHPLITLFTTYAAHSHSDDEKNIVHNNTLVNWAALEPRVNLILFTNDSVWDNVIAHRGWEIIRKAETETPPLLKDMFEIATSRYDTPWYGYVNADILFTRTFMETLESMTKHHNPSIERVLLIGRRLNLENLENIEAGSLNHLHTTARKLGHLYREDAEDFFLASKTFPWKQILPVVVGVPGYDNWLIAEARCRLNTTVVDVTDTLDAVHQTTKKGGNHEGHSHSKVDFNYNVFKTSNITPNYIAGLTSCATFRTYKSICDTVEVEKRTDLGKNCMCKAT